MPSNLHGLFTKNITHGIHNQINAAIAKFSKSSSTSSLAQFLRDVEETTTSDVEASDNPRHRRSPDASFCCNWAQFPGLIIETAYSQGSKSLRRVADDWVMLSDGNVKMVIGLEIGYRARKNAKVIDKVFVWEPNWKTENVPVLTSECTVNKVSPISSLVTRRELWNTRFLFNITAVHGLDAQRQVTINEALTIPLCALAPLVMLENYGIHKSQHSTPVASIPMTALAAFLDHAQDTFDLVQARRGYKEVLPPQTIKRRWSSSSEEDLREQDARREELWNLLQGNPEMKLLW
ncbi:hypothetical protein MMC22_010597 [Lobaria immixta]|nr:hypothetical protein [Lobaria immixta]